MGELSKFVEEVKVMEERLEKTKERLQWLLSEIDNKEKEVDLQLKEILDGKKKDTSVNRGALYGWGEALFWVREKIEQAFKDIVKEQHPQKRIEDVDYCPKCGIKFDLSEHNVGDIVECWWCGEKFIVDVCDFGRFLRRLK